MNEVLDIYKDLFSAPDVLSVICRYLAYSKCTPGYDFGYTTIRKGTQLYRIRKYDEGTDYHVPSEWAAPPTRPEGRCNKKGEEALYLGSDESICLLETHIRHDEQYVLASYTVIDDIRVGGFIYVRPNESQWKRLAGILLNAFLIAPSRSKANQELFQVLDSYYKEDDFSNIKISDIAGRESYLLPYRIGAINKKDKYHKLTNDLCDILKAHAPCGIRYSSCYIPFETVGIQMSAYNVVLYHQGMSKVRFEEAQILTNDKKLTESAQAQMAKIFLNQRKEA